MELLTTTLTENLLLLRAALAIGLLIGTERGWSAREAKEGGRTAGIRTYGLIALLGGCTGLLSLKVSPLLLGIGFVGFAIVLATAYIGNLRYTEDISITGIIAALLTFIFGAMSTLGFLNLAGPAAVVTTLLLGLKPTLHGWLQKIEKNELFAALKLLLISVVFLSILPNKGYGPYQSLNPFEIWWMVVLVASISFIGYCAMKVAGAKKGVLFTAIFAGFVSSTAFTFYFSRLSKKSHELIDVFSSGILLACGVMFLRTLIFIAILNVYLLKIVIIPAIIMAVIMVVPIIFLIRKFRSTPKYSIVSIKNPLELRVALLFGVLLTAVLFLSNVLKDYFGDMGTYSLAVITGFIDVDALVLPFARMSLEQLNINIVSASIIIAAVMNTIFKFILILMLGHKKLQKRLAIPFVLTSLVGFMMAFYLAP